MSLADDLEQRFRVPEREFRLADRDPGDRAGLNKKRAKETRAVDLERLAELQNRLYAEGRRSLLVVLQGVDASGKDGTIRHVMSGVNPQGVDVTSFKRPTPPELAHDYLWRTQLALPARGHIGVFNRSHYEEVLVARVHPELLAGQAIDPARAAHPDFWTQRFEEIAAWERHLTNAGTRTIKFFLHISKSEQLKRFMARAERPEKAWKFEAADLREHHYFDAYQHAYEAALRATSSADEPWYVIPANHKWFLRTAVSTIIVAHLSAMDPAYPVPSERQLLETQAAVKQLASAGNGDGEVAAAEPREAV